MGKNVPSRSKYTFRYSTDALGEHGIFVQESASSCIFWVVQSGVADQTSSRKVAGLFSGSFSPSLCRGVYVSIPITGWCSVRLALSRVTLSVQVGLWLECSTLTSRLLVSSHVRKDKKVKAYRLLIEMWVGWNLDAGVRYHRPSQGQRRGSL